MSHHSPPPPIRVVRGLTAMLLLALGVISGHSQTLPTITQTTLTKGEVTLKFQASAQFNSRLERSANLVDWSAVYTFPRTSATQQHVDASPRFEARTFYRIVQLAETNALTGDHLPTKEGDLLIHPVNHASFIMTWKDQVIYADPVGGASLYRNLPRPTLILVTDIHGDHVDSTTINGIGGTNAVVVVPSAVLPMLSTGVRAVSRVLANGANLAVSGLTIEAIPMYNLTAGRLNYHSKGRGNGYVLTLGDRRVYISGDTEDIPEMRALRNIDVAFVCMNLPFTMDINQAASAAREFRPRRIFPYHFSSSNVTQFKELVGTDFDVEVLLRKWY